jgi:hypothetical protein
MTVVDSELTKHSVDMTDASMQPSGGDNRSFPYTSGIVWIYSMTILP